jgi:putative ABC transport system permease protein
MLILLSIVAALLITISLLNYILIVISSMVHRAKEIGVRKCYGATAADIYALLAREAVVHLLLALALAAAIIFASRGVIQNLLGVPFWTLLVPQSVMAIGVVLILVLFVSIVVPAKLYLRIPVSVAFRNYSENSRRWKIALLGIQVLINVFIIALIIVLSLQYRKMVNADQGYDYQNTYSVAIFNNGYEAQQRVLEVLSTFPEVKAVGAAYNPPFVPPSGDNVYLPGGERELFNVSDGYEATESFFQLLDFDFVAGRAPRDSSEVAVSESFVERMAEFADWSDGAVGNTFLITGHPDGEIQFPPFTISGIYRDVRMGIYNDLQERPSVYFHGVLGDGKSYMPYLIFKTYQKMDDSLSMRISHALSAALDGRQLPIVSWQEEIRSAYEDSRKIRNTLLIGSFFAMLIAMLGLVGFVRDETNRRSKEIAIRKINGATSADVHRLLVWDVLKFSLVMAAAGCVGSYFAATKMLQQFAERITLTPLLFIGAAAVVLLIAFAVVLLCCHRLAKTNPSQLLRNE